MRMFFIITLLVNLLTINALGMSSLSLEHVCIERIIKSFTDSRIDCKNVVDFIEEKNIPEELIEKLKLRIAQKYRLGLFDVLNKQVMPHQAISYGSPVKVVNFASTPEGQAVIAGCQNNNVYYNLLKEGIIAPEPIYSCDRPATGFAKVPELGNKIFIGYGDGKLVLFDLDSRQVIKTFELHMGLISNESFAFDIKNKRVFVSSITTAQDAAIGMPARDKIYCIDLETHHTQDIVPQALSIRYLSFDSFRSILVVGCTTGKILFYDLEQGILVRETNCNLEQRAYCPLTEESIGSTVSHDIHKYYLYDTRKNITIKQATCSAADFASVALSYDGQFLLTSSRNSTAYDRIRALLFDLAAHRRIYLEGHTRIVNSVALSSNSRYALTGSQDGSAIIWDLDAPAYELSFKQLILVLKLWHLKRQKNKARALLSDSYYRSIFDTLSMQQRVFMINAFLGIGSSQNTIQNAI